MELPLPPFDSPLGAALARLAAPDLLDTDPLVELAADHGALIAFAIGADGTVLRVSGAVPDAITGARGDTEGADVFEIYADVPDLLGAVARALRGVTVRARLTIDGAVLDCHYVPVRAADGEVLGLRGVALPVSVSERPADLGMSQRETEVACLLARGMTNAEIGRVLFIEATTVSNYVRSARIKAGVRSRGALHTYAVERGWHHLDAPGLESPGLRAG